MKNITIILLIITGTIQAQSFRKIIPFKYNGKWGLVGNNNTEFLKPTYKGVHIFQDFTYVEMDGEVVYNLKNGERNDAYGEYCSSIKIENKLYHLFTNEEKSTLLNMDEKETISLSLQYRYMQEIEMVDESGEKKTSFILARLTDRKFLLLNLNKSLNSIIAQRFSDEEIEFITNEKDKVIGFVVKHMGYYVFYNHNLKVIKKMPASKFTNHYELLPSEVSNKLPTIYSVKDARAGCFNCEEIWDDSWELNEAMETESMDYYIVKNGYNYTMKKKGDENFNLDVSLHEFDYEKEYKAIYIRETRSTLFYDERYMKMPDIIFPRHYLNN